MTILDPDGSRAILVAAILEDPIIAQADCGVPLELYLTTKAAVLDPVGPVGTDGKVAYGEAFELASKTDGGVRPE